MPLLCCVLPQGSAKGQGSTPAAPKKAFQGKLAKGKKSEQEGCEQGEQRQSDEEETVEHFLNRIQERKRAIAGSPMDEIGSELALHQMLLLDQAAENRRTWAQVLERVEHEAVKERERREERLKDVAEVSNFLERVREVKRARQTPKSSVHKGLDEQAGLEDKLVRDAATNEDAACVVCGYAESGPPNDIIFCERCELAVHQNCYGIKVDSLASALFFPFFLPFAITPWVTLVMRGRRKFRMAIGSVQRAPRTSNRNGSSTGTISLPDPNEASERQVCSSLSLSLFTCLFVFFSSLLNAIACRGRRAP